MRYFVTGHEMLLYLSGDREEHKEECCFELPDFESKEEAVAAAREFIKERKNAVNDQKHGIGSVTYWTAEVTRCIEDEDFGWLHYRDLKSRCPVCKRPAHIAKRDGDFYFVDDEYNPFVRHAPVKTMGSSTTRKTVIRRSTVTWIR